MECGQPLNRTLCTLYHVSMLCIVGSGHVKQFYARFIYTAAYWSIPIFVNCITAILTLLCNTGFANLWLCVVDMSNNFMPGLSILGKHNSILVITNF